MRKNSTNQLTTQNNVLQFPSGKPAASAKRARKQSARRTSDSTEYEIVDLNEYSTGGKEGLIMYRVTGRSCVPEIKEGYLVLVDPNKKPELSDITLKRIDEKNYIHQYTGKGWPVVAHFAVYRNLEVSK